MFIRNERSIKEFLQFYPVVGVIVIINLAIWLIDDLLQLQIGNLLYQLGAGSNYYIAEGQYWRLVTPIFLHAGFMHVLFNSFALVLFGPALEQMLGKFKFIMAYLATGIAGNVATFVFGPSEFWYVHVGASGSVYGLMGIYIFMVLYRKHLIDQGSSHMITVIFVIGIIMTFLRPGINIHAHIFGAVAGFAIAPVILSGAQAYSPWRNRRRYAQDDGSIQFDPDRWRKKRLPDKLKKNIIWIILGILVLLGLFGRMF
ncbi:rhomboid family intramembrane serine protease [Virgibacillus sp. YIM 98842]|jgi:membrane associated rhomboid family serine protease|uniref:rhomboid family intramembrane serine protease n=1 Tax=Virgibacillus sp. YIM 98842 TaxID=2663533 RepID=UPI0013DC9584|nr:rhomboid family intramembrane serine protease [Virgibacillus sp. YIM 98842]